MTTHSTVAPLARTRGHGIVRTQGISSVVALGVLVIVLAVVALISLVAVGEEAISPIAVLGMALQWLPVHPARTWSDLDLEIITMVRLPRIVTAIMVGGALAITGASFQALFRNPLADPGIVGTSAGASLGAIVAFLVPVQTLWFGFSLVPLAAFGGAVVATLVVYSLARVGGRLPSTTLLLAGFAVSSILNACAALVETMGDQLRQMYGWLLGSLDVNTGEQLLVAVPLLLLGSGGLLALAGDMNVLVLGEEQSHYLGLNVTQRRLLILIFGSLLTSVAVALGGMIALLGLLVPHIARMLFGANHRLLLPASLLVGAIFLIVVDAAAHEVLGGGQVLPIGVITALIGGPWFIILLRRNKGAYAF